MTKFAVDVYYNEHWESIALFADTASLDAMIAFAETQFENGNSLTTPGENICIVDTTTGEVLWDWESAEETYNPDDYFPDDVDESFYDPYSGCDFYETCDFDGGEW